MPHQKQHEIPDQSEVHVLVRRPATPIQWDPISRPHVAILLKDANGRTFRCYLSRIIRGNEDKWVLEVADLDSLPDGTILEVKINATTANLYQLERVNNAPRWKWISRCRCLPDFDYPSGIEWDVKIDSTPRRIVDVASS